MTGDVHSVTATGGCDPAGGKHCAVCADEALPAVVVSVDLPGGTAEVRAGSLAQTVALDLVDGVMVGSHVLVHLGFVITCLEDA